MSTVNNNWTFRMEFIAERTNKHSLLRLFLFNRPPCKFYIILKFISFLQWREHAPGKMWTSRVRSINMQPTAHNCNCIFLQTRVIIFISSRIKLCRRNESIKLSDVVGCVARGLARRRRCGQKGSFSLLISCNVQCASEIFTPLVHFRTKWSKELGEKLR